MCEPTSYSQVQLNSIFSAFLLSETYTIVEYNNYILQVSRDISVPQDFPQVLCEFKDAVNSVIGVCPCVAYQMDVGCVHFYLGVEEWTTDYLCKFLWD